MKKILLACITIVTMMLCMAQSLFVYADSISIPEDTIHLTQYETTPDRELVDLPTLEQRLNNSQYTSGEYFLYFNSYYYVNNGQQYRMRNVFFHFDSGNVTFENDVLEVTGISQRTSEVLDYNRLAYETTASPRTDNDVNISSFKVDFANHRAWYTKSGESTQYSHTFFVYSETNPAGQVFDWYDIYTNIPEFLSSGGMNIEVNFTPPLSGNVDRKINGVVSEEFSIEIINHGSTNVQCLMSITGNGQTIDFYDNTDSSQDGDVSGVVSNSSRYQYVWWSDEWNYSYDSTIQTTFAHAHHPNASEIFTCTKQLGPCPWHYVPADGIVRHDFDWSQINLDKNTPYTVSVYAMIVDSSIGCASRQAAFSDGEFFVDYSTIECVYSSNFVITNGYTYDQNNTNHGNYRSMGNSSADSQLLGWTSKGTMDGNGNVDIKARTLQDNLDGQASKMSAYTEAYIKPNWDGSSRTSYSSGNVPSSLKNHFNNFMSFVNYGFGRFPSDIQTIFIYGFVAVVVLGIVLKVIK